MDFLKFSRTKKSVEKQTAPVAQLDRAPDYGSGGLWFMSYGEPNKAPKNLIPKHQTIFLVSL